MEKYNIIEDLSVYFKHLPQGICEHYDTIALSDEAINKIETLVKDFLIRVKSAISNEIEKDIIKSKYRERTIDDILDWWLHKSNLRPSMWLDICGECRFINMFYDIKSVLSLELPGGGTSDLDELMWKIRRDTLCAVSEWVRDEIITGDILK